ncbi:MAG: hypothetical protein IID63_00440 [candidate division Zixibacteria bacterium]|nr:hypothetical protein [candidate division Zixibacteria bacterium]
MNSESSVILKIVFSVLFFPLFFQESFVYFAWAATDQFWIQSAKRVFLLLPVMAIILGCWTSIACLLTVVIRQNRREFLTSLIITWWDLGKSIVMFWGGIIKFAFTFVVAVLEFAKITAMALWSLVQEILFTPFRMFKSMSQNILSSPVPWLAVFMTIFWCLVEATIFTYVMTPLVLDVFSNITGEQLQLNVVRVPLFTFLFFIVLGSYAVLSNLLDSVKQKNIQSIIGIGAIEAVVLFVEVLFLYREFVDSLVPWFAQYSESFELGIVGTLAISCFVWFGIRSLTWFLFAAHGTPTILYLIQGKGVVVFRQNGSNTSRLVSISPEFVDRIKYEMDWMRAKGEEVMADLMLPPLQIVAAALNFCTLLLNSKHLFELPFKSMSAVTDTRTLMKNIHQSEPPPVTAQAPAAVRSPVAARSPVVQQEEQRREPDNVQI